ncbi:hypothetical protein MmTuc01_1422 [Methanosarcina mazei Tuc01]|uniref:Uncharacterized protein n=1 Tax=Methanosarcina mazei Tuc01 TaxID=1236903 RepID=M1Q3E1_METMZ|nr:hypothetical protein MmTuc01_1422 [Methanosarcina mazei Tuc01]
MQSKIVPVSGIVLYIIKASLRFQDIKIRYQKQRPEDSQTRTSSSRIGG